ncbi:MAG: site-2 protease family protein [Candidatus Peribacteria bacterium]|nr:site-2 protease family protein [Candidatus Peribacteria bacterium]
MIFLIGFGRGKPVQINPSYYKKPLRDELITSLAGPGMNLLLAIIGMLLMMSYARITDISLETLLHQSFDLVTLFWFMFITINLSLAAFNLLPIFPLDGYRLVKIVWKEGAQRMERNAMIISIVLLVLIL